MDCSNVRKILQEHIEGNGPQEQQTLVKEHLQSCEQCRLYASELMKTVETLQCLDQVEPPAWLTAKVMKKIREEDSSRKRWIERLFFPLHIKIPIEVFATLLITVAAIFVFNNMGPEIQMVGVQPQAPAMKSMPAESEKELQIPKIQKQETKQPQRLGEEAKHKDSTLNAKTRSLTTLKEERPVAQRERSASPPAAPPMPPAPASSFAPSPVPGTHQHETGKSAGLATRDEMLQKSAPTEPLYKLQAEKKAAGLTTFTLTVKALDAARKEIETYLARNNGEMKTIEQSESRIIITIKLDPAKIDKLLSHLGNLGTMKEDPQALSLQSALFKLVIEKQ